MPRSPYVYDRVFKYVFGEPESLPILQSLINAFFRAVGRPLVVSLELLPREISENRQEKAPILDVVARDETGQTINVEIQTSQKPAFFERTLYYWSRLFSRQAKEGDDYRSIAPVVSINLLDYEFDMTAAWLHNYELPFTRHLGILYVELPKVLRLQDGTAEDLKQAELWSKFIESVPEAEPEAGSELTPAFTGARLRMEEFMALTPEVLWEIQQERARMDEQLLKNLAREEGLAEGLAEGRAEGLAAGREEGRQLGLEDGRVEGRVEGRMEGRMEGLKEGRLEGLQEGISKGLAEGTGQTKTAIAAKLKKNGMAVSQIAEITDLPAAEIEKL